jgi:hypothetical protein
MRSHGFANLANEIAPRRLGVDRLLPVHSALSPLFPGGGLRRGSVVSVAGDRGATSLALSLLQVPAHKGSWTALIDTPDLGMLAASELGFPLGRCVAVSVDTDEQWAKVLGVAVGAFELVLTRPSRKLAQAELRPLLARMREEGSVLVLLAGEFNDVIPADIRLEVNRSAWQGLSHGSGRLLSRKIEVKATGRGAVASGRFARFWMPGIAGDLEALPSEVEQQQGQVTNIRAVS